MNDNIIDLDLSQKLKDSRIVEDFIFDLDTKNFVLDLNDVYQEGRVIVSYNKNWTRLKHSLQKQLKEKDIKGEDQKMVLDTLDANFHTITLALQEREKEDTNYYGNTKTQPEEEKKEKAKKVYVTYKYSQDGKGDLYESIILAEDDKPYFLKYDHAQKQFEKVERIEESTRVLRPPVREEYPYTAYEFLNLEEINQYKDRIIRKNTDIDYLFQKAKSIISKYNNQDEYKLNLAAADVILSIFQDRFSTIHYVYLVGGNGSGKSSLADTFAAIAYRVVIMTDPTAPNLFRLLGVVEQAQCTLILEEAERIDKSQELMAVLKTGTSRNGRVPRINPNTFNQEFFFSYGLKIIVSERSLGQSIAKGVNTRIFPIHCFKGETKYDIKEILNPTNTGGVQNKEFLKELKDFRRLLLIYRLMHFKDPIPDLDVGVKGRDKELVKHLVQLFYGSKFLYQIIESLQIFLDIKNQKKKSSLDDVLLPIISDLISEYGTEIYFRTFWNELKETIPGKEDEKRPTEYHTEDYGTIFRSTITNFLSDTFGAKTEHKRDGNILIFDREIIEKLSKKDNTKILVKEIVGNNQQDDDEDANEEDNGCEEVRAVSAPDRGISTKIKESDVNNIEKQTSIPNSLTVYEEKEWKNNSSLASDALTPLTLSQQCTLLKIKAGLFKNPLISGSDLLADYYDYDPEIINNIDRYTGRDRWFCKNCSVKDDKWGIMKHRCKNNKKIC